MEITQSKNPSTQLKATAPSRNRPYPESTLEKDPSRYCVSIYQKTPQELYAQWRKLENLPSFMKDLKSIEVKGNRSVWTVELENGVSAQWTAEIIKDVPGEMIAWKSTDDSEIKTDGSVWFRPSTDKKSTVVGMTMDFQIPGGKLTELVTGFKGEDPTSLSKINLKRFKALMETGVIPTIEGQSSGREGENQ